MAESEESNPIELMAPNGVALQGTSEEIPGCAQLLYLRRNAVGETESDWVGGTEVFWDGQQTIMWRGRKVFIDENGDEWLESQLIPTDTAELPADPECLRIPTPNTALAMLADAQQLLIELCEWDTRMGVSASPVWGRARDLRDRLQDIDQGPPRAADTRDKEPVPYDAELERLLRELDDDHTRHRAGDPHLPPGARSGRQDADQPQARRDSTPARASAG